MRLRYVFLALSMGMAVPISATARSVPSDVAARTTTTLIDVKALEAEATKEASAPAESAPVPVPTPFDFKAQMVADRESYTDVFSMLREENSCSLYFGGPAQAAWVFNELVRRMQKKPLGNKDVGIRMSGSYTRYEDSSTGASYRLFDEVEVNSEGPFFHKVPLQRSLSPMVVGRFPASTRQARALLLLHELAHLVRGENGEWLIPNDGGDASLSARNTRAVEKRCLDQLIALEDRRGD